MSQSPARLNKIGQMMGAKGEKTRQCLIKAAEELLRQNPTTPLTTAAVSRHAKIAPPTFYVYFDDIKDLVAAVVEAARVDFEPVYAMIQRPWDARRPMDDALEFVRTFSRIWVKHYEAMVLRNYEADKGDEQFLKLRAKLVVPFLEGLTMQILRGEQISSRREAKAHAMIFYTMLERLANLVVGERTVGWSPPEDVLHAQASMLTLLIVGKVSNDNALSAGKA